MVKGHSSRLLWIILDGGLRRPSEDWHWPEWMVLSSEEADRLGRLLTQNEQPLWDGGADLRRAKIEPYGWVVNKSMAITGTRDALLRARIKGEAAQIERVKRDFAKRVYGLDFRATAPVGLPELRKIAEEV